MKVIIAEKPSVAKDIAAIIGAENRKDGYLEGNGYTVTWAYGHLLELAMPQEYGFESFKRQSLPIIPKEFKLSIRQVRDGKSYRDDAGASKQLKVIKSLFDRCEHIIVATDAGREGELIFRYIYQYLGCSKPFKRLWINSLTEQAIRKGLVNLHSGEEYDNLYCSAKARSEADWLVGINASQALSISAGYGSWSLGRVQTPTLSMICSRYLENKDFKPKQYWQHKLNVFRGNENLQLLSLDKYYDQMEQDNIAERVYKLGTVKVKSIDKKTTKEQPPSLHDLTSLQKDANKEHSFSADKTLKIAQSLYEKKLISYPRTGSRYIPEDVFITLPDILESFKEHEKYGEYIMPSTDMNQKSVDDKKVTDHHAIIVTGERPCRLSSDETVVFEMVLGRMLEAFSTTCIKQQTTVMFDALGRLFNVKGTIVKQGGWRKINNKLIELHAEDDFKTLPPINEGDLWEIDSLEMLKKQTKPLPLHTEASLLSVMETCGKELACEAEREALKDAGIGTPATRANIIETLFKRAYIKRKKKSLVPTDKGMIVYNAVKNMKIADVSMTGEWENALRQIEAGELKADDFNENIEIYTHQIISELLNVDVDDGNEVLTCPKCSEKTVILHAKLAKCRNERCDFLIFRDLANKTLSDTLLRDLLQSGHTSLIKGFKSRKGKSFEAAVKLDDNFKTTFFFPASKVNPKTQ